MTRRWYLAAAALVACSRTTVIEPSDLEVTTVVRPDTISIARDSSRVQVLVTARNPFSIPVVVNTRSPMYPGTGPFVSVFGDSALLSSGAGFAVRVASQADRSLTFTFMSSRGFRAPFAARETQRELFARKTLPWRSMTPGTYEIIGSYARQESKAVRVVVVP